MKSMLDREWTELISQAKSLGLTVDEVREFLDSKRITQKAIEDLEKREIVETPTFYPQT